MAASDPMPAGVALTTRSAAGMSSATRPNRPTGPASAAAATAFDSVRLTTATSAAPAAPRARITARAAPPAPITAARLPCGLRPASAAKPATNPVPSVFSARSRPSTPTTTQLAASSSRTASLASSAAAAASALRGMVTDSPARPSVLAASRARAPDPAGTSKAAKTQSSPTSAKAALWMAGDREWRTGSPITAATLGLRPPARSPGDSGPPISRGCPSDSGPAADSDP